MITKTIISYKSYKDNDYDKSITVICPPLGTEFGLIDLPSHRREAVEPIIDFIEKDLSHKFEPATDEVE